MCQCHEYSTLSLSGLFQPLSIPTVVEIDISMDFIEGLPSYGSYTCILVVVGRLSKFDYFSCRIMMRY